MAKKKTESRVRKPVVKAQRAIGKHVLKTRQRAEAPDDRLPDGVFEYGDKDLIDGELNPADAKIKVTMYLDGDLLLAVKKRAKEENGKYQSLINETLRRMFLGTGIADQNSVKALEARVALLEKIVAELGKKAS